MALQPLSLVPAAYRPRATNQRLCPWCHGGSSSGWAASTFSLPSGWVSSRRRGADQPNFDQLFLSCPRPVGAVGLSPRRRQYQWSPADIPLQWVPCVLASSVRNATSLQHDRVWSLKGPITSKSHMVVIWSVGASALVPACLEAARALSPSNEKEASGVRMRKVLSNPYTRRGVHVPNQLYHSGANMSGRATPGREEAMEARQKQARSPLAPGCA